MVSIGQVTYFYHSITAIKNFPLSQPPATYNTKSSLTVPSPVCWI